MSLLFSGLAPHASFRRILISLRSLCSRQVSRAEVDQKATMFASLLGMKHAFLLDSGRSALTVALQSLNLKMGDEILVSGYTCMVVANAIHAAGLVPRYVDIDVSLAIDPERVRARITDKTKAILLQYTFGEPGQLERLLAMAKQHRLYVVEDAAHALFGQYQGALLGTLGDIAITSFGREKCISSERGGAVFTSRDDVAQRVKQITETLVSLPSEMIRRHLLTEFLYWLGKHTYAYGFGKILLRTVRYFSIIPPIISAQEKRGQPTRPRLFPEKLFPLLTDGLAHAERIQNHRQAIATIYDSELLSSIRRQKVAPTTIRMEYAIWVSYPDDLISELRNNHKVFLSRGWGGSPVVPRDASLVAAGYRDGACPRAEEWARGIVLLPTHESISVDQAKRLCRLINAYVSR